MSKSISKFVAAMVIYAGFAVYLYQPYFKDFHKLQYFIIVNVCLASLGCFVLSRRWVIGFWCSFFAGAIYGFGPFALGLAGYHPTVGFLTATVPWLFCPAAFVRAHFCKRKTTREPGPKAKWQWIAVPLSVLPFLAILIFFQISTHYRLFAIPTQAKLHLADLSGLLAPLVMVSRSVIVVSFYHIPIASLIMGFSMFLAARRLGPMYIFCLGTVLAFCDSLFNISPIVWLSFPILCCSVLVGIGMQGLASAGFADRKWILASSVIMGVLAIATLLLATEYFQIFAGLGRSYAKLFAETAKMYILGAIAVVILYFMARAKLRIRWLRLVLLCSAMAVDIFFSTQFIVDRIF